MDNDFQKRLLATFRVETREHLTALSAGLIELEKSAADEKRQEILEAVTREAHSLKGAARAVSVNDVEQLKAAMKEPEKYRHLKIRIGGWEAFFVDLPPAVTLGDHHFARELRVLFEERLLRFVLRGCGLHLAVDVGDPGGGGRGI